MYKYSLTKRGLKTIYKDIHAPITGWRCGWDGIVTSCKWINVQRGPRQVRRIQVVLFDGTIINSLNDWKRWNSIGENASAAHSVALLHRMCEGGQ